MNKKILFTDLDGTLLNTQKEISPENAAAIDDALLAGHKIVISTGRPLCGCLKQIRDLHLDRPGCYAITYNGGLIYDCYEQKAIYRKSIPIPYVKQIFEEAKKRDLYCQTYSDECLLAPADTEELRQYIAHTGAPYRIDPALPEHLTEEPVKILVIDLEKGREYLDAYRNDMELLFNQKLSIFYSNPLYLEHVSYGISKGNAITWLCGHLQIPLSHTIAAGDQENDISMIRTAHIGVAMANAIPSVKSCADYITNADCDHSGIAEVIGRFMK